MVSGPDGRASALYNMALAGTPQKVNVTSGSASKSRNPVRRGRGWAANGRVPRSDFPFLGLAVDKLRLGAWVRVAPKELGERVWGCENSYVQKGRKRVDVQPAVGKAWTKGQGEPGGVYLQITDDGLSGSRRLVVEFNPAKLDDVGWGGLGLTLRKLGVLESLRGVWVDRVDAAFDWEAPRCSLVLDDRQRLADHFGVGRQGPQTERTGFRRGSKLKHQLYDKTAERRAAGADARANVTRYEVQLLKPDRPVMPLLDGPGAEGVEALPVVGLADLGWPGGDVTVRCLPYHPMAVADPRFVGFLSMVRGQGVRAAIGWARDVMGVRHQVVDDWMWLGAPEVCPPPRVLWARHWFAAASECVERLRASVAC